MIKTDVHYILFKTFSDNQNLIKFLQDTNILVAPYTILVGQGYKGCMAGLSVGTWVKQNPLTFDLSVDRPLNLYGGKELSIESFSEKGNIKRIFADKRVFCKLSIPPGVDLGEYTIIDHPPGVDLGEYTIRRSQLSEPTLTQCMFAPNTYIEDFNYAEPVMEINGKCGKDPVLTIPSYKNEN